MIVTSMNHVIRELIKYFVFGQDDRNDQCDAVMLPFELVTTYWLCGRLFHFVFHNLQLHFI